jgi:opacity protein-like surface antigen
MQATLVGVAVLAVLPLTTASAAPAVKTQQLPFGHWVRFGVGGQGTYDFQGVFTFQSDGPVRLRVTDGFCRGDRFGVLDHGHALFQTSDVPVDQTCLEQPFATTGSEGWHDSGYSRGSTPLGPGPHRIRLRSVLSPFGGSTGWLEVLRSR